MIKLLNNNDKKKNGNVKNVKGQNNVGQSNILSVKIKQKNKIGVNFFARIHLKKMTI